jgi:hypothetical protein
LLFHPLTSMPVLSFSVSSHLKGGHPTPLVPCGWVKVCFVQGSLSSFL